MALVTSWLLLCFSHQALSSCQSNQWTRCPIFCGLTGQVPHSNCTIFQLDSFNKRIRPILERLLQRPYFRFYKTQLHPNCSFWPAADQCFGQGCTVHTCSSTELPEQLARSWDAVGSRYTHSECEENDPLGHLDMSKGVCDENGNNNIDACKKSSYQQAAVATPFCPLPDDENEEESVIVDLQRNPERYTGYRGESSWRVWRAIYGENCFWSNPYADCKRFPRGGAETDVCRKGSTVGADELCFENQVFYNIISGFHASVNVHVCAQFFFPGQVLAGHWGYNLPEFTRRFGSIQTNGEGIRYLKNLYFLYLLELRALIKAEPMLRQLSFEDESCSDVLANTGSCVTSCDQSCEARQRNSTTYRLVNELLDGLSELACSFDESQMFRLDPSLNGMDECATDAVREMFRTKFVNITKILDCVACDKCRMWGRLQIKAVGTALNILFHDRPQQGTVTQPMPIVSRAQLVALLNGFGRCSESLSHIAHFRKMSNENFHTEL